MNKTPKNTSVTNVTKNAARIVAANAVRDIIVKNISLDNAINSQNLFLQMSSRDRAFARLITTCVFRRLGQIDKTLSHFVKKNTPALTMAVLRCGVAQILFLQTPAHAAVNGAVAILKKSKKTAHMAGLANAVLRKVAKQGDDLLINTSTLDNIPKWPRSEWYKNYGSKNLQKMADQLAEIPPLDITVKQGGIAPDGEILYSDKHTKTIRLETAAGIINASGFEQGDWWVQDISAALPVRLLGDIKGKRVLDMCAAPGGKTMQLAMHGANVVALDKDEARIAILQKNLKRTQLKADCIVADALRWRNDKIFDIVLLDAPCSATGVFRRNPDVLYTKTENNVKSLARLQEKLLLAAARQVKPNGVLLFCTCSLQKEEGEEQVDKFLQNRTDFRLISLLESPGSGETSITSFRAKEDSLRILPHFLSEKGGQDGFFIAGFTRY